MNNIVEEKAKGIGNKLLNEATRDIIESMGSIIRSNLPQRAIIEASRRNNPTIFSNIMKILQDLSPERFKQHSVCINCYGSTEDLVLSDDVVYNLRINRYDFFIVRSDWSADCYGNKDYSVSIEFFGPNKWKYKKKMMKRVKESIKNGDGYITIINIDMANMRVSKRSFERVILKSDVKRRIVKGIYDWVKAKQWYEENQLVYKLGILLYGPPGTGKSSICRAIASMFQVNRIINFSFDDIENSLSEISYAESSGKLPVIVLMEDIDRIFSDDNPIKDPIENNKGRISVTTTITTNDKKKQILLQILDGVYSNANTIYIATTNHIENLDPAIRRYGRFDIQEKIDYFEKQEAVQFVKNFGLDETFLKLHEDKITYPIQPSYLQSLVMQYRNESHNK